MNGIPIKRNSLLFILSFIGQLLWGQSYKITQISQEEGLSYHKVVDITQDKYGLMWFATLHGLNRYDGQNIEIFRSNYLDTLSIEANSLIVFYKGQTADLWMKMAVGGLSRYNQLSRQFEYFVGDRANRTNINNTVVKLCNGKGGDYWVITKKHLNLLDLSHKTYHPFIVATKEEEVPINFLVDQEQQAWLLFETSWHQIESIDYAQKIIHLQAPLLTEKMINCYEDTLNNKIYVTTEKGLFYKHHLSDSIYPIHFDEAIDFAQNKIRSMVQNKTGDWFFNLTDRRCFQLNQQQQVKRLLNNEGQPIEAGWLYANRHDAKLVVSDSEKNIHVLDPLIEHWEQLEFNSHPSWASIEIGWEGIIWLGSIGQGVFKVEPRYQGLRTTYFSKSNNGKTNDNSINAFLDWDEDHLFVGASNGLYLLDSSNNLVRYQTDNLALNSLLNRTVFHLMKDDRGYVWLASLNGVVKFHPKTKKHRIYNKKSIPPLYLPTVLNILQDHQKNIWMGGPGGLCVLPEGQDTSFVYFQANANQANPAYPIHIRTIYEDSQQQVWLGTSITGLAKANFDQQDGKGQIRVKRFPWKQAQTVNQILEKEERYFWLGNYSSGLMLFDKFNEKYLSPADPSLSMIPNIQGLLWKNDQIWISAINGLYSYQPQPSFLKHYTTLEGLHSNTFELNACMIKRDGDLLFGGHKGLTCVNPKEIQEIDDPYKILLTNFYLSGNSTATETSIQETKNIQLPWDLNHLGFEIKKPIYFSGQRHKLFYRMEGLETYWNELNNQKRITYPNLKSGDYNLKIRSVGQPNGYQNHEKRVAIHISEPYWKGRWFHFAMLVVLLGVTFLIYRLLLYRKMQAVHILNDIRQKAAADFHDEMGHRLARINLFAEVLSYNSTEPENRVIEYARLIKENVHCLNSSMQDFLWALDPSQDSAFDLALILKDFGDDFFDQTPVIFTINHLEDILKKIRFSMDNKRHIVLIFKEAMTNILKHAKATSTKISFIPEKTMLVIRLEDNGVGMQNANKGYGIQNMQKRARQMNAKISFESTAHQGTLIQLELPLTKQKNK